MKFESMGGRFLSIRQSKRSQKDEEARRLILQSGLFDAEYYVSRYPDVSRRDPLGHYLKRGAREGRATSACFDGGEYLRRYADVRESGANPLMHFLQFGQAEGRSGAGLRDLIEESGLFDTRRYRTLYPDIGDADPLEHYLEYGGVEGRSPSRYFDGDEYMRRYPEVRREDINPLVHFLLHGRWKGRRGGPDIEISDEALDTAQAELDELKKLDDAIAATGKLDYIDALPRTLSISRALVFDVWREIYSSLESSYDYIVFVPWLTHGGADLVAIRALKAALDRHGPGRVLLAVTDNGLLETRHWLPEGAGFLSFSEFSDALSQEDRAELVEALIYALHPRAIYNVNSFACWNAVKRRGKALSQLTDIYASIFAYAVDEDGRPCGYAVTHFRDCLPYLKGVYTDNETIARKLKEKFGLPQEMASRIRTVYQPVRSSGNHRSPAPDGESRGEAFRVFWAGRLSSDKNIGTLMEVSEKAPHIGIDVYGVGDQVSVNDITAASQRCRNLDYRGAYEQFEDIPAAEYDAYLFTSFSEGMPNALLEAAWAGLPVVASNVGGVPELISSSTGWPVDRIRDPFAYIDALEEIARSPEEARLRGERLRELVTRQHCWDRYVADFSVSPSFLD